MTRSDGVQSTSKDSKQKVTKQLLERIKEATGADDEVITHTLEQCNYDPNEATARLIESKSEQAFSCCLSTTHCTLPAHWVHYADPFSEFVSKNKRKQQVGHVATASFMCVRSRLSRAVPFLQRAAESAKDPRIVEVKRAGSTSTGTRGGRGYGRGDRQGGERSRSVRGMQATPRQRYRFLRSSLEVCLQALLAPRPPRNQSRKRVL